MSASIEQARRARLRQDVTAWARQLGFTPRMSIDDPDSLVDFVGACVARFPAFTHAHGCEVFAWCRESVPTIELGFRA